MVFRSNVKISVLRCVYSVGMLIDLIDGCTIISTWQRFDNRKSVSQNKMCKSGKMMELKQNSLSESNDLPNLRITTYNVWNSEQGMPLRMKILVWQQATITV